MWLYRAMEEENGQPRLGMTATTLGIRPGKDIAVDAKGLVHQPSFAPEDCNGLSCSPDTSDLPAFVRPISSGGTNKKTRIWAIHTDDLDPELIAQEDTAPGKRRHVSIAPAWTMLIDEYQKAIQITRSKWRAI